MQLRCTSSKASSACLRLAFSLPGRWVSRVLSRALLGGELFLKRLRASAKRVAFVLGTGRRCTLILLGLQLCLKLCRESLLCG